MIITYLGKNCKSYMEEIDKIYEKIWVCPDCHERAHIHSGYIRKVRESGEEEIEEIKIIRIKCTGPKCGKTHAILPDFLCPNKRYGSEEISETIEIYEKTGKPHESVTGAEESTIRRWVKGYKAKYSTILKLLESILIGEYGKQVSLIDSAVSGLARLRVISCKMIEIKYSSIMGKINQLLSLNGLKIFF
jgi:hypothetical protein